MRAHVFLCIHIFQLFAQTTMSAISRHTCILVFPVTLQVVHALANRACFISEPTTSTNTRHKLTFMCFPLRCMWSTPRMPWSKGSASHQHQSRAPPGINSRVGCQIYAAGGYHHACHSQQGVLYIYYIKHLYVRSNHEHQNQHQASTHLLVSMFRCRWAAPLMFWPTG